MGAGAEVQECGGAEVRARVLALEVEGLWAPGEQASEVSEQEGIDVAHGFQGADEGGDLSAEVADVRDDPAEAVESAREDVALAFLVDVGITGDVPG